jgi:hypothetical protein
MAIRFLPLHRAALLFALLPISAQAAGLKSTTEETVKALTAINIPVQKMRGGLYMKTEETFIVMVNSAGGEVRSLEYISTTAGDAKSIEAHKKNVSKLMAIALPKADEDWSLKFIKGFFDKSKDAPAINQVYAVEDKNTGVDLEFASVMIRYKPKTGAFLFRLDAIQPEDPASAPSQQIATAPVAQAKALKPKTLDALLILKGMSLPVEEISKGEYMAQRPEFLFRMMVDGDKVTQIDYAGQVTGKKETLNNHILRVKFLLDAFIPGTNEDKVNATLSDLVATLDKQPERLVTLGDSIALKSKYANPGVWMLTAKPQ